MALAETLVWRTSVARDTWGVRGRFRVCESLGGSGSVPGAVLTGGEVGSSEVVKMFNCQSGAQETIDARFS